MFNRLWTPEVFHFSKKPRPSLLMLLQGTDTCLYKRRGSCPFCFQVGWPGDQGKNFGIVDRIISQKERSGAGFDDLLHVYFPFFSAFKTFLGMKQLLGCLEPEEDSQVKRKDSERQGRRFYPSQWSFLDRNKWSCGLTQPVDRRFFKP